MPPAAALECDYLVVGGGAMGMAFADTLVNETKDLTVIIVDKRAAPGGHWNDAYPFVRLHQPSQWYGVNSRRLENTSGLRTEGGAVELATAQEVITYFRRVLEALEATGRVRYMPMCQADESGRRVSSLVNPELAWEVTARRKVVDATYMHVTIPARCPPPYAVQPGALVIPPNDLPSITRPHPKYVVIGAGKTGIDAVLWMLRSGISPDQLSWIMPRDGWFMDRDGLFAANNLELEQKSSSLIQAAIATKVGKGMDPSQAAVAAMEEIGFTLRLDKSRVPTGFRCATVDLKELEELRRVKHIVRLGHVKDVGVERLLLDDGELVTGAGVLHVNCAADGLAKRPPTPIFNKDRLTLQPITMCQQVFSAAVLAHLEAMWPDDEAKKNEICIPVPHPNGVADILPRMTASERNLALLLRSGCGPWLARSRLWSYTHRWQPQELGRKLEAMLENAEATLQGAAMLQQMEALKAGRSEGPRPKL